MTVDDVDREKRRASAEKQKSVKDVEKKKTRKKNLEQQALKVRQANSRRGGILRRTPLMKTTRVMAMTTAMILRGWQLASTRSKKTCRKLMSLRHARGPLRSHKANLTTGAKRVEPIRPLLPPKVEPFLRHSPFWRPTRATGSKL